MNGREGSGALRQEAPCPTTARDHEDGRFYANVTKPSPAPEQLSMNMYAAPAMTSTLMMFVVVQYFVAPWPRRARGRGPRACANQLQAGAVKRRRSQDQRQRPARILPLPPQSTARRRRLMMPS